MSPCEEEEEGEEAISLLLLTLLLLAAVLVAMLVLLLALPRFFRRPGLGGDDRAAGLRHQRDKRQGTSGAGIGLTAGSARFRVPSGVDERGFLVNEPIE